MSLAPDDLEEVAPSDPLFAREMVAFGLVIFLRWVLDTEFKNVHGAGHDEAPDDRGP